MTTDEQRRSAEAQSTGLPRPTAWLRLLARRRRRLVVIVLLLPALLVVGADLMLRGDRVADFPVK